MELLFISLGLATGFVISLLMKILWNWYKDYKKTGLIFNFHLD